MEDTDKYKSLTTFLKELYKVGGIPLTLIGLGAGNLFIPEGSIYSNGDHIMVSMFLFATGIFAWSLTAYMALRKWEVLVKVASEQDKEIIRSTFEMMAADQKSDVRNKSLLIKETLEQLQVRRFPAEPNPDNRPAP